MSRRRVSRDLNQQPIVDALRDIGVVVYDASHIGGGFPDLICAFREAVYLMEVKNPDNWYGKRGMNENQQRFSELWQGIPIHVVRSVDDALRALGVLAEAGEGNI